MRVLVGLAVGLLLVVGAAVAEVPLSAEHCAQTVLPSVNQDGPDRAGIPIQDLCSLWSVVVRNRYSWNWKKHLEALATGTPAHLRTWVEFFACKAEQCAEFQRGQCLVSKGPALAASPKGLAPGAEPQTDSSVEVSPCPASLLAYSCFPNIFDKQFAGCFDGLYDRI